MVSSPRNHPDFMPGLNQLRLLIVLLGLVGLAVGCATTDGDYDSDLPWNTPQSWEGSPSIPGFDER